MPNLGQFYNRHEKAIGIAAIAVSMTFCAAVTAGLIPGGQSRQDAAQAVEPSPQVSGPLQPRP